MRLFDFGTPLYKGVLTITSNHVRMSITGGVNNLYIFLSILPRSIELCLSGIMRFVLMISGN